MKLAHSTLGAQGGFHAPSHQPAARLALDEHELALRWNISVKTLRRWRQSGMGPGFLKLGARVTYLIPEIEAHEQRCARLSTSSAAFC